MSVKCIALEPYKLRDNKLVSLKETPLELDWAGYKAILAPSGSKESLLVLRKVKVGCYIGLVRNRQNKPINFVYTPVGYSKDARGLFRQIPNLETSLISVYKVTFVDFGNRVKY